MDTHHVNGSTTLTDNSEKSCQQEKTTATKVFEGCLLTIEIIGFFIKLFIAYIQSIYQIFRPPPEKSVAGELILVTGTGHGIGKELAKQYGELGAEIICVDVNTKTNQETVDELKKLGIKAHAYTCDVSKRENVLELGKKILEEVGDVTILVNNAGIMPCKKFLDHKAEEIKKMFDINIFAHFWMLEAFLPAMMKNNKGHIVAISSIAGVVGSPNIAPYCASKFAVKGFMESIHEEFRREGKYPGINFTTIYPFITDTGLCQKPRIRFNNLMKVLSPAETASAIVSAQRRGYLETSVPPFLLSMNHATRAMPIACASVLVDFFDSRLDPHDN